MHVTRGAVTLRKRLSTVPTFTASMTGPEPALVARNLVKTFGDGFTAVAGIDVTVPRGVCYGFLGPNGAGKTSTMRMVYGLSPVTSGELQVLGMDVTENLREVKARLGVVPQENNLDEDLTVLENLVVYARFFGIKRSEGTERAREALAFVQLEDRAGDRVGSLSGGMRRRLAIARALVNDPDLLVLDEPTTGLDPQARSLLWEKIRELKRTGKTILLTTHYMDEAEQLCDELVIMDRGHVIARGKPADLVREHVGREVLELTAGREEREHMLGTVRSHIQGSDEYGERLLLYGKDADTLLSALQDADVDVSEAVLRRASLEDVFLKLTGRTLDE